MAVVEVVLILEEEVEWPEVVGEGLMGAEVVVGEVSVVSVGEVLVVVGVEEVGEAMI